MNGCTHSYQILHTDLGTAQNPPLENPISHSVLCFLAKTECIVIVDAGRLGEISLLNVDISITYVKKFRRWRRFSRYKFLCTSIIPFPLESEAPISVRAAIAEFDL